jgi:chitodextrinase
MSKRLLGIGLFAAILACGALSWPLQARARSSYYGSRCASCHGSSPTTCVGCHFHLGTLGASTDRTSYAPGSTVTVTITGGNQPGWVRGVVLDSSGRELARSPNDATFPIRITLAAPIVSGTHNWTAGVYVNGGTTADPANTGHGTTRRALPAFTVTAAADTSAPSAPTNLTSPSRTSTSVSLSWTASTDGVGVTGYDVYRGTTLAGSSTTTSYTVTGLTANTAYSFTVRARDAAGNVSGASAALSVTTSTGTATAGLRVQYRAAITAATTNQVKPVFNVVNGGTTTVALNTLTLRYWYTIDGAQPQTHWCDWAARGCANITARFVSMGTATSSADSYLEVGFTAGAGSLSPGQSTGEVQSRFAKNNWTNYNQSNDHSFDATKTAFADWNRVTLHQNGVLVWGTEPTGGGTADTAAPSAPTNLTSPSKTSTSVSLAWTASTDNVGVTGYDVYRGTTLAGTSTTTSSTVTGLTANTAYSFTVRARDAAGNVSASSAALSVTTSAASTASISVAVSSLDFGNVQLSSSRSQTVAIRNAGGTALDVTLSRSSSTSTEFTPSPSTFSLAPGGRKIGVVTYQPTATGADTGALLVTSNDAAAPSLSVSLRGNCVANPFPGCVPTSPTHPTDPNCAACHSTNPCTGAGGYPGCTPTSPTHTTSSNCVSCHSTNPCTSGGVYPGCAAPSNSRHAGRTDCATCHSANPCTSFPFPGCRMPSEDHSATNANCAQCHGSNPCSGDDDEEDD